MINFNNAEFSKSVGSLNQLERDNAKEIVFSGKSNVGKSSLINKLVNRKSLARVSNKPGKTININLYNLNGVRFVDLPGYGYAKVSFSEKQRWAALLEGYFELRKSNIALVVQIIDMRHPPSALDLQMIDFLFQKGYPFVIVASKCDKLRKLARAEREEMMKKELRSYGDLETIVFSSETGEGLEKLKNTILSHCEA